MKKAILCILDGFGLAPKSNGNAISLAQTPFIDGLIAKYPNASLKAHGLAVGLPDYQMGNSEVGHITIGAGQVFMQDLERINQCFEKGEFNSLKSWARVSEIVTKPQVNDIHITGLFSDGGVHSHMSHLVGLIRDLQVFNKPIFIHLITDGRDTKPQVADKFLADFIKLANGLNYKIASVSGRFYAMDRDNRAERTEAAINAMQQKATFEKSAFDAIKNAHAKGDSDEFVNPVSIENGVALSDKSALFIFNFRADRARQLTKALSALVYHTFTFTEYDKSFYSDKLDVIFAPDEQSKTLGEVVAKAGLLQLRAAETEKYAHVTFFFNGGREEPFENEERLLVNSPKDVKTYDEKPEMSAFELTEKTISAIKTNKFSLIVLNYANCDMIGHTGDINAAIKALNAVDECVKNLVNTALENGYELLITADHGNIEEMIDETGGVKTSHSLNLVPVIYVGETFKNIQNGELKNICPTILNMLNLEKPAEIESESLVF